jgi:hypothetical protein
MELVYNTATPKQIRDRDFILKVSEIKSLYHDPSSDNLYPVFIETNTQKYIKLTSDGIIEGISSLPDSVTKLDGNRMIWKDTKKFVLQECFEYNEVTNVNIGRSSADITVKMKDGNTVTHTFLFLKEVSSQERGPYVKYLFTIMEESNIEILEKFIRKLTKPSSDCLDKTKQINAEESVENLVMTRNPFLQAQGYRGIVQNILSHVNKHE